MFLLVLIFCFIATSVVMLGNIPPVFNQKLSVYRLSNAGLLSGMLVVACALIASTTTKSLVWLRRGLLVTLTFLISVEGLLYLFDKTFVDVTGSPLPTAFRTISVDGERSYLPQPNDQSPFGFRTPRHEALENHGQRLLFLGNSYVRGTGSTFETNYPQAVEADLQSRLPDRGITIFSAGVDAYGVKEDRLLYKVLLESGYKFDAVVVNFVMGADPTNDIPGTDHQSIAGQPQHLHENLFIRTFYPFNTYLFRYLLFVWVSSRSGPTVIPAASVAGQRCRTTPTYSAFVRERAFEYYGGGASERLFLGYDMREIAKIASMAAAHGSKMYLILLPDPNALLAENREMFRGQSMQWDWTRRALIDASGAQWPTFDLAADFRDRPDLFRCNDNHWSDSGNVVGAKRVAAFLAAELNGR